MKKEFTPIAMLCNQEQFEAIKPKLKGMKVGCISNFNEWNYLVNNADGDPFVICNTGKNGSKRCNREIHETWNEEIFLNACGIGIDIEKTPTLQEVKEYFKNAEIVKCAEENKEVNITVGIIRDEHWFINCVWVDIDEKIYGGGSVALWSNDNGYAKILNYKQPTYTITKEQLLELENGFTLPKLKQWFPEVFEVKLEVGKWITSKEDNCPRIVVITKDNKLYGINTNGLWFNSVKDKDTYSAMLSNQNNRYATHQEVFEALKNEAVKRGFVEGVYFNCVISNDIFKFNKIFFYGDDSMVWSKGGGVIFKNGKWATIIPTIIKTKTKEEAEKLLNCKIID